MNQLFKIYFHLKQQSLCTSLIRAVFTADLPDFSSFPKSHYTTFKYYNGLVAFFDENYEKAKTDLMDCLNVCHKHHLNNKRKILHYLIPTMMILGKSPSFKLLQKYDLLNLYKDLISATKSGNLRYFQHFLDYHEITFVQKGTFLTWEKLYFVVYRQLLRKMY
jgi:hypothetical protein